MYCLIHILFVHNSAWYCKNNQWWIEISLGLVLLSLLYSSIFRQIIVTIGMCFEYLKYTFKVHILCKTKNDLTFYITNQSVKKKIFTFWIVLCKLGSDGEITVHELHIYMSLLPNWWYSVGCVEWTHSQPLQIRLINEQENKYWFHVPAKTQNIIKAYNMQLLSCVDYKARTPTK